MERIPTVLFLATMDTKADQVAYLQACLREASVDALLMDVGIMGKSPIPVAVSRTRSPARPAMLWPMCGTSGMRVRQRRS